MKIKESGAMFEIDDAKLEGELESLVREWIQMTIEEYYNASSFDDLTREQVDEVKEYINREGVSFAPYVHGCLSELCDNWYTQNQVDG